MGFSYITVKYKKLPREKNFKKCLTFTDFFFFITFILNNLEVLLKCFFLERKKRSNNADYGFDCFVLSASSYLQCIRNIAFDSENF